MKTCSVEPLLYVKKLTSRKPQSIRVVDTRLKNVLNLGNIPQLYLEVIPEQINHKTTEVYNLNIFIYLFKRAFQHVRRSG